MIVVDASAALELLLRTPLASAIESRIAGNLALHVPHLIDVEITQALRRHARLGELDELTCHQALQNWLSFRTIRFGHEALLPRVWQLKNNLTAYDAIYVALAEALDAPLITHDRKLASSPGHTAAIEFV